VSTPPTAPPRPPGTPRPPGSRQEAIDPRFRQRLIEVRRIEGRRRLRVLLILVGFLAFALLAWAVSRSPFLDVDHVRVTGTVHTSPELIANASGVHKGMAMLDVEAGDAAARVRAVPWILRAHVERHWPATVTIEVVERAPVAAVPAKSGVAVVDRTGRVLAIGPTPPADFPVLLGLSPAGLPPTRLAGRAADLLAVAQAMPPQVTQRVAAVVAADGGQVELRLRPAGVVELGPPDQLADKMLAIQTVLTQVDLTRLAVLDVRVPASPAITRG
jgi:cell division protein FtsQ